MTTKTKVKNKKIEYTIEAKLYFDFEENIDIERMLDEFRGIGTAEVVEVKIVEDKDANS
jgi:hypothetical protein